MTALAGGNEEIPTTGAGAVAAVFASTIRCRACSLENDSHLLTCTECASELGVASTRFTPRRDAAEQAIEPGAMFADRYSILETLGRGGCGAVFRAVDRILDEELALKLLRPDRGSAEQLDEFVRETSTARRITHENVVRVYDLGISDDLIFLSMELVPGGTLADWIARHGASPPLEEALTLAEGICRGLDAAHRAHVIHSDIKPANVLIAADGRPLLADFGIARLHGDDPGDSGDIVGTPLYMSPEQFSGEELTARSDIYSLGVMLYELFTGAVPFHGPLRDLVEMHCYRAPAPPSQHNAEIPPELDRIILRALAKSPAERFGSAREIGEALAELRREPLPGAAPSRPPLASRVKRWSALALVAAATALLGVLSWGRTSEPESTEPTASETAGPTAPEAKQIPLEAYEKYRDGMEALRSYQFNTADSLFVEALTLAPQFSKPQVGLAYSKNWTQQRDAARAAIEKARKIRPLDAEDREFLALIEAKNKNEFDRVRRLASRLNEKDPDEPLYAFELADLDYHEGQYTSAMERLSQLTRRYPRNTVYWEHYTWATYLNGDEKPAAKLFDRWRRSAPTAQSTEYAYWHSVLAHIGMGDMKTAAELISDAEESYDADYRGERLWLLLDRDGVEAALAHAVKLEAAPEHGLTVLALRGLAGRVDEYSKTAVANQHPTLTAAAAFAGALRGDDSGDIAALLRRHAPGEFDVTGGFTALVAALLADDNELASSIAEALEYPQYAALIAAYQSYRAGNLAEAGATLDAARGEFHVLRDVHVFYDYFAGQLAFERGDPAGAIRSFEAVSRLRKGSAYFQYVHLYPRSLYWIGRAHEELGDRKAALASYKRLLALWARADRGLVELRDARARARALRESTN